MTRQYSRYLQTHTNVCCRGLQLSLKWALVAPLSNQPSTQSFLPWLSFVSKTPPLRHFIRWAQRDPGGLGRKSACGMRLSSPDAFSLGRKRSSPPTVSTLLQHASYATCLTFSWISLRLLVHFLALLLPAFTHSLCGYSFAFLLSFSTLI